jgi:copper chaperone CopZ
MMLRTATLSFALFFTPAAMACGDNADCACQKSAEHAKAEAEAESTCGSESDLATDVASADGTKVVFAVKGMTCGGCAGKIRTALDGLGGVNAAFVSFEDSVAQVAFDADKVTETALVEAIAELGYDVKVRKQG